MKRYMILLAFCLSCFLSFGNGLSDELAAMKEDREGKVKIGGVNDETVRNELDEKSESLKFYTNQYEDDELLYRVRVTAELTDKKGEIYFAQLQLGQGSLHEEYTGEDIWEFEVPHGELEKPKLTAYAIQYGFLKDGTFVPVAEEFDDVDSPDEITERAAAGRLNIQCTKHIYKYRDNDEISTSLSNHKSLK